MKQVMMMAVAVVFAVAAVGCKDKCIKACEHVNECLDGNAECDEKCKDVEGMDKKDAKDAAKCILDLSCGDIEASMTDPTGGKLAECATE